MNATSKLLLNKDQMHCLDRLNRQYGYALFRRTFNDFLIMGGICPDLPVGFSSGQVCINGIWQAGVTYTQYHDYRNHLDKFWSGMHSTRISPHRISKN